MEEYISPQKNEEVYDGAHEMNDLALLRTSPKEQVAVNMELFYGSTSSHAEADFYKDTSVENDTFEFLGNYNDIETSSAVDFSGMK